MQTFPQNRATLLLAVAMTLAGSGEISAQQPAVVDSAVLKKAGTPADPFPGSWLTYGKSQSETRYSPLKQIDAMTVKRLGLEWSYVVGAGGYGQEGTPLVWNNTIYGTTTNSVVYAVDARTGKQNWRWDPEVNQRSRGINANRGLALYNGKLFAPAIDGRLIALDATTGKPAWEARVAYPQDGYYITMAPRIAGGKVIVGVSGGDTTTRGFFDAYDATTGQRSWRFYTVPGDPSKPFENDAMRVAAKTWGGDFYTKGGGGAVWDGFAYDPDANLVYVGTGNAEPWTQKFRGAKNLDNLYTCSILAVDLTTGKLKWHFQTVPNDNWDFDSVQQLMLLDLRIEGRVRRVLTQAAKNGFFYAIDRVSGQFISAFPFVKVNWAKGIDDSGRPMVNPEAYYDVEPVAVYPTGGGGADRGARGD
jgi:quinohemoprotein ethanol dehydrogenase